MNAFTHTKTHTRKNLQTHTRADVRVIILERRAPSEAKSSRSFTTFPTHIQRYTLPGISVSMKDRAQETCACEFYSQQR